MFGFLKRLQDKQLSTNSEHIRECIAADSWMLYCACGVRDQEWGFTTLSWDMWWSLAKFHISIQERYAIKYPRECIPSKKEIEAELLVMIKGRKSDDFRNMCGLVLAPGESVEINVQFSADTEAK